MPLRHVSHSRLGSPRSLLCGVLASLVVAFAPVPASAQAVVQVPASVADAQARAVDTARARVREHFGWPAVTTATILVRL